MIPSPTKTLMFFASILLATTSFSFGQNAAPERGLDVTAAIESAPAKGANTSRPLTPAVLWLKPLAAGSAVPWAPQPRGSYTLLQKNKMFTPHLLVIPVGGIVQFPNQDPFFHNVFSLFDGKRFDLGLYEAGKTKDVTFTREGVSYIFCNIHSEMSAVVIALFTPFYSVADRNGVFRIAHVPPGDYEIHVWVEGQPQAVLERWVRRVSITAASRNLGAIAFEPSPAIVKHSNKFGQPYAPDPTPQY